LEHGKRTGTEGNHRSSVEVEDLPTERKENLNTVEYKPTFHFDMILNHTVAEFGAIIKRSIVLIANFHMVDIVFCGLRLMRNEDTS
jgi:hypothetical protein